MLANNTGVHHHTGNNTELGTACGKSCRVRTLAIVEPGDSDITRSMPEQTGDKQIMYNFSLMKLARACLKKKRLTEVIFLNTVFGLCPQVRDKKNRQQTLNSSE